MKEDAVDATTSIKPHYNHTETNKIVQSQVPFSNNHHMVRLDMVGGAAIKTATNIHNQ